MNGVDWYMKLTDEEQGQVIAFRSLLDIEIRAYDNLAEFLDAARGKLCDMQDKDFKIDRAIRKYYDAVRATEECAELMSSKWVDGKAAKIMQNMYNAQSELFALIGIDYHGGHVSGKREES